MSISVQIYSNANSSSRSVTFDLVGDILASNDPYFPSNASCNSFYFKITANGTQDNNASFPVKIVRSLSDLVLFKSGGGATRHQSALNSGSTNTYSTIKEMVVDYTWDYINGHASNAYGSECTYQGPMKFN